MIEPLPKKASRNTSSKAKIDYSALELADPDQRIGSVKVGRKTFWIKNFRADNVSWGRLGHAAISIVSPAPIIKATPVVKPQAAKQRELEKLRSFAAAGFGTPDILHEGRRHFVMSGEGDTINIDLARLQDSDPKKHDRLLIGWIEEIGKVHAAGLCHGRPHVKDIIFKNRKWVHLDFEEAPETVMPLATAQARDLLLVFHQLVARIRDEAMLVSALESYRKVAPAPTIEAARKSVATLGPLAKLAEWLCRIKRWKDIDQFSRSIRFLKANL